MTENAEAEKDAQPTWPREIWMLARDKDDQGYTWASLSEFGGGDEADLHRYVDGDIYDSADRYWRARISDLEAEVARLKSEHCPSSVADNLIASAIEWAAAHVDAGEFMGSDGMGNEKRRPMTGDGLRARIPHISEETFRKTLMAQVRPSPG